VKETLSLQQAEPPSREEVTLSWGKRLAFGSISVIFGLVLFACLGELGLRVFTHYVKSFRSAPFRQYDPLLGISLIPNKRTFHSRGCFQGEVVTNRWGFRDRERSLEKSPGEFRIALLGDSAVEAVQVKPEEVMNIRMEKLLQAKGYSNTKVLAFAVEGIGTTQELLMYQKRVRQFHPDLVILLWIDNDVMNNSSTIQPKVYGIHTWYAPYYDLGPDGNLVFRPVAGRPLDGFLSFLESHGLLVYYLERIWDRVGFGWAKWEGIPLQWGVYGDPLDPEWERAWLITEKVLAQLAATVENDGAKFVVAVLPNFYKIDPDWRQRFAKEVGRVPRSFNPETMDERLQEIANRNHIALHFLAPYLQTYRDEHHLRWPYFSFTCDPHYSPLGNEVAAEAIVEGLEEHRLLPPLAENLVSSRW
jgi:hypothetical protein